MSEARERPRESASWAARVAGPLATAVLGVALLAWTWRKWPDVLVDFGAELYVPWRMTQGAVLYRDLAYFTGPLSPHVNALWFTLFDPSLMTLAFANIALLALTTGLLYTLCTRLANRFAATIACLVFLALNALALHQGAGNYNFVCPYSHELTHGTLLVLNAMLLVGQWIERRSAITLVLAGLLAGAVFLTKVELTVALALGIALALSLARCTLRERLAAAATIVGSGCVLPLVAFGRLAPGNGVGGALRGVLGAWVYVGDSRVSDFPLYRAAMGLLPFGDHAAQMAIGALVVAIVLNGAALSARRARTWTWVIAFGTLVFVVLAEDMVPWNNAFYSLPLWVLAIGVLARRAALRDGRQPRDVMRCAWAALALVMLGRIFFNARVQFYGFALTAPALALCVLALCAWFPEWIAARHGASANLFRAAVLPLLAGLVVGHWVPMHKGLEHTTVDVGRGRDRFLADPRGAFVQRAVDAVTQRTQAADTVLVLPEGAMINYLARRASPTCYFNFMPPELAMFGEARILEALRAHAPEFVVLVHRDTSEYGVPLFGADYGVDVMRWVRAEYAPVELWSAVGNEKPLEPGTRFAVAVLKRRR